jgi:hypothetical protein
VLLHVFVNECPSPCLYSIVFYPLVGLSINYLIVLSILAVTVLLISIAAIESLTSLVTKSAVVLKVRFGFLESLFSRRNKATLNGIQEYCNPNMSPDELKVFIEPVRPTPATVAEGVTLPSKLT